MGRMTTIYDFYLRGETDIISILAKNQAQPTHATGPLKK